MDTKEEKKKLSEEVVDFVRRHSESNVPLYTVGLTKYVAVQRKRSRANAARRKAAKPRSASVSKKRSDELNAAPGDEGAMDTKITEASSDMESEGEDKKNLSQSSGELVKFFGKRPEADILKYSPRLEMYTALKRKRCRAARARSHASEAPDKRNSSKKRMNENRSKSPTENKRGADSKSHSQEKGLRRNPRSQLVVPEDKCCPRRRRRRSCGRRRRRRSCRRRRPRRRRSCRRRRRSCRRRRSRRRRRRSCRRRRRRCRR